MGSLRDSFLVPIAAGSATIATLLAGWAVDVSGIESVPLAIVLGTLAVVLILVTVFSYVRVTKRRISIKQGIAEFLAKGGSLFRTDVTSDDEFRQWEPESTDFRCVRTACPAEMGAELRQNIAEAAVHNE